jgi:hypothetical protein
MPVATSLWPFNCWALDLVRQSGGSVSVAIQGDAQPEPSRERRSQPALTVSCERPLRPADT